MNKTLKLALVAGTVLFAVPSYGMANKFKSIFSRFSKSNSTSFFKPNSFVKSQTRSFNKKNLYFKQEGSCALGCEDTWYNPSGGPGGFGDTKSDNPGGKCLGFIKCRNKKGVTRGREFGVEFLPAGYKDDWINIYKKEITEINKNKRKRYNNRKYLKTHSPEAKILEKQNNADRLKIKAIKAKIKAIEKPDCTGALPFLEKKVEAYLESHAYTEKPKEYSQEAFQRRCERYKKEQEKKIQEKKNSIPTPPNKTTSDKVKTYSDKVKTYKASFVTYIKNLFGQK